MKNAKLLAALLAGFSIALIFGFTKDGGVKKARKHASIICIHSAQIKIISPTDGIKEVPTRKMSDNEFDLAINKSMNELEEQGYELVSTESHVNGGYYEYIFREKEAK